MTEEITSAANPLVKRIKKLRQRKYRDEERAFFVEGIRPVWSAVANQAPIESLIVADDLLTSTDARDLVENYARVGGRIVTVSPEVFVAISEREHPSGLAATVRAAYVALGDVNVGAADLVIALEDVGNPGNLGTILRTADAAGASAVILAGEGTDPFHPTAVKASMGTVFTVPIARAQDISSAIEWARDRDMDVVATSAHADIKLWQANIDTPVLILFGSEATGLAPEVIALADVAVKIPMSGDAGSLNLAVATGIVLFDLKRKDLEGGG